MNTTFKTEKDHLKTTTRLAFERAMVTAARTKVSGKVYRTLCSNAGIKHTI